MPREPVIASSRADLQPNHPVDGDGRIDACWWPDPLRSHAERDGLRRDSPGLGADDASEPRSRSGQGSGRARTTDGLAAATRHDSVSASESKNGHAAVAWGWN